MDLCLLHHMQRKYRTFRIWTWDAMDRYQSSYVCGLQATIPAMLKHRLTPPPRETYSDSWVPQQETERCFLFASRLRAVVDTGSSQT